MTEDSNNLPPAPSSAFSNGNGAIVQTIIWRTLQSMMATCIVVCGWFLKEVYQDIQLLHTRIVAVENTEWTIKDHAEYSEAHNKEYNAILPLIAVLQLQVARILDHIADPRPHAAAFAEIDTLRREINALEIALAEMRSDIRNNSRNNP